MSAPATKFRPRLHRLGVERLEDRITPSNSGSFNPITSVSLTGNNSPGGASSLAVGNLFGTGNLDVATANFFPDSFSFLKGSADGTLTVSATVNVTQGQIIPTYVQVADYISGGTDEVAIIYSGSQSDTQDKSPVTIFGVPTVTIYQNNGSGTFGEVQSIPLSMSFTGNVFGSGTITTTQYLQPFAVTTGDFGGGNGTDLLVIGRFFYFDSSGDGFVGTSPLGKGTPISGLYILQNNGSTFTDTFGWTISTVGDDPNSSVNVASGVVAADFNLDGQTDFAFSVPSERSVYVALYSAENPNWPSTLTSYEVAGNILSGIDNEGPAGIGVGDFNEDGFPDIVTASTDGFLSVLINNGSSGAGTFAPYKSYGGFPDFDNNITQLVVADFTLDGHLDVAVMNNSNGQLYLSVGNGIGTLKTQSDGYKPGISVVDGMPVVAGELRAGSGLIDVVGGYLGTADLITFFNAAKPPATVLGTQTAMTLTAATGPAQTISPFPGFGGDVRVAMGDVTGDGVPDFIVTAGPGGGPVVHVYDGFTRELIASFMAYDENFRGGVYVAVGDVDGDGIGDIITGAGAGGAPHVKAFKGGGNFALIRSFFAYDPSFRGGVTVAAGDTDGDGVMDIVTGAASGGSPHVKVFDGLTGSVLQSFFAFDTSRCSASDPACIPNFVDGVSVAAGNLFGTGRANIIVGALADQSCTPFDPRCGSSVESRVRVFGNQACRPGDPSGCGSDVLADFTAYDDGYTGGVRVGVGRANGKPVILTGSAAGAPHVKAFDPKTLAEVESYFAGAESSDGGVWVSPTA